MTEFVATTPGLFPPPDRTEVALDETASHERARERAIEMQLAAGLDRVVEGQRRWVDRLAHPLAVHDAVETGDPVRYYDTDRRYREPAVTGPLDADGDLAADHRAAADLLDGADPPLQAVAPGPYTLADLASDEHYGDEAALLAAVAEFLAGEVDAMPDVATLFLLEPSLVANPPGDGRDARAGEAVDRVAAATDADVVVHTCRGALPEKTYAHLFDAGVDAVGHDLVAEAEATATLLSEYGAKDGVALGLVDGTSTRVESPETVRERVEWVRDRLPGASFDTVYVTPNVGLFSLPVGVLASKLAALADGVAVAGEET